MKKQSLLLAILLVFTISVSTFAGDTQTGSTPTAATPVPSIVETIVTVLTQVVNIVP